MLTCRIMTENACKELQDLRSEVGRLSGRVKLFGLIVTLGSLVIPAWGQISSAHADSKVEKLVTDRIESVVNRAAEQGAERALKRQETQQLMRGQTCE